MKLLSALSVTLAMTTRMIAAIPVGMATGAPQEIAGIPTGTAAAQQMMMATNVADEANINSAPAVLPPIRMKEFTGIGPLIVSTLGAFLGTHLTGSLQNAVAEIFKGGDLILNGPLDIIEKLLHLNIPGALGSLVRTIAGTLQGLPKDAVNILSGGKQPERGGSSK